MAVIATTGGSQTSGEIDASGSRERRKIGNADGGKRRRQPGQGNCLDFVNIRTITQMVFQRPGVLSRRSTDISTKLLEVDIQLARRCLSGETFHPADRALWFYNAFDEPCRAQWFGQWNSGRFKSHCFYAPVESERCF